MVLPSVEWDEFVALHPHFLFQKSLWGLILQRGYGAETAYYALKQNGRILLGLPGVIFDFKCFRLFHGSTPYGGFVGESALIPEFMSRLPAALKKERVDLLRITQNAGQPAPSLCRGRVIEGYQHLLEFEGLSSSQIWQRYEKNAQRNVKKSTREGLSMRPIRGAEEIQTYYEMYVLAMRRSRAIRPHTRKLYEAIYEDLIRSGRGTVLFAEHGGKVIAGILLLFDASTVYFLGSAFYPETHSLRPNDFLMHAAIQYSQEHGFSAFDFMTTSASQEGLAQYKEKWGAAGRFFRVHEQPLSPVKSGAWHLGWKCANTPLGTWLIECLRGEV